MTSMKWYPVWRRNYLQFKRSLLVNVFWIVIEPLFYLLAIGYGLGAFVANMGGVSYTDFFFPALLCNTTMLVSFFESTYGNFSRLTYQRTYETMMLAPLSAQDIVLGEILWGASKGFFSALGVTLVATLFGHVNSFAIVPALLVIFLSSVLFAAIGMIVTSIVKNYDGIIYPTSGFIVPMSLLSGTYFPLDQLPFGLRYLSLIFPLTHSVNAVRSLLLGGVWWQTLIHILVLAVLSYLAVRYATQKIQERLLR